MKAQIFRLALLSYRQSGLLQLASEKLLFLNDPNAECRALGASYGFGILTPAAVFAAPHRFPIINRENPRAHLNAVAGGSKSRPRDSAYAPVAPDVALSGETVAVGRKKERQRRTRQTREGRRTDCPHLTGWADAFLSSDAFRLALTKHQVCLGDGRHGDELPLPGTLDRAGALRQRRLSWSARKPPSRSVN